ncbi:MAG: hypothetical protein ACPLRM_04935, partial [Anaerolineae bacterium]
CCLARRRNRTTVGKRMKLLIDMNLSPDWAVVFEQQGWQAHHWSTVGDPVQQIVTLCNGHVPMAMSYSPMTLTLVRCWQIPEHKDPV